MGGRSDHEDFRLQLPENHTERGTGRQWDGSVLKLHTQFVCVM
jgi:hypothetical protein